ncbi:MAG: CidA/LrgA family protein [Alphaproteobacteria bacterium]|jgi:holin-like protein|nr:CidA/LrgA family protein [Alphaproteobacteria bacterium]MBL6850367.1 CidA/LrgA family protein [Alphaproteobacteria bacterium]
MLNSIFTIFLFQLAGEFVQKFFELSIPGPVIGLILLLSVLLLKNRYNRSPSTFERELVSSCESLLNYLPLLFIPVGVGVVMHLTLLEENLISVITIIILGTLLTLAITGFIMERLLKEDNQK